MLSSFIVLSLKMACSITCLGTSIALFRQHANENLNQVE
jgi:hypothetical protein